MAAPMSSPLTQMLRLQGEQKFIVHHEVLSLGHSYKVTDFHKRHLFTIRGNRMMNIEAHEAAKGTMGTYGAREYNMSYELVDAAGQVCAQLMKQGAPNLSTFTLADQSGAAQVQIQLKRGLLNSIEASAMWPTGQPMLSTHGSLLRHNFMIKDAGGQDVARVHEDWVAVGDTYGIELTGPADPIYPLVFAIAIDYEKVR